MTNNDTINVDRGGYLYKTDNKINLFLYIKLNRDKLLRALPMDAMLGIPINHNYLIAHFVNDIDYLGHGTFTDVKLQIESMKMLNIYLPYATINDNISLTYDDYEHNYNFAVEQLIK